MNLRNIITSTVCGVALFGVTPEASYAELDEFNPFMQFREMMSNKMSVLPATENICCLVDPLGNNTIVNHSQEEEYTKVKKSLRFYRRELKRTQVQTRAAGGNGNRRLRRLLKRFRRAAGKCLQSRFPYDNQNLYPCDSFAAMIGGQAKLTPTGEVTVIFETPIDRVSGEMINFFSGSKDDVNRQLLFQLPTQGMSFPAASLTFQLTSEQCRIINQTRDFNLAVPLFPIDATKTGDFTELGNECEVKC